MNRMKRVDIENFMKMLVINSSSNKILLTRALINNHEIVRRVCLKMNLLIIYWNLLHLFIMVFQSFSSALIPNPQVFVRYFKTIDKMVTLPSDVSQQSGKDLSQIRNPKDVKTFHLPVIFPDCLCRWLLTSIFERP